MTDRAEAQGVLRRMRTLATSPWVGRVLAEAGAQAASALTLPLGASRWPSAAKRPEERTVVFVHGLGGHCAQFEPMRWYLRMRGIRRFAFFRYRGADAFELSARELRGQIQERLRGGRVDLVAHSAGGLVARTFVETLGGHRLTDRCVMLATPHQGTELARWVPARALRQLRPHSPTVERLSEPPAEADRVAYLSICAGADHMVMPRTSGQAPVGETVEIASIGHTSMLLSPEVWRRVGDFLLADAAHP